jgi:alpha-tubulin suppressor-like RCC1 family protein
MSFARAFARLALSGAVLTATACRDDTALPTDPVESGPAAATAPAPPVFRSISAGANHTCGVTTSSRAYCWGSNFLGQLGSPGLDSPLRGKSRAASAGAI